MNIQKFFEIKILPSKEIKVDLSLNHSLKIWDFVDF